MKLLNAVKSKFADLQQWVLTHKKVSIPLLSLMVLAPIAVFGWIYTHPPKTVQRTSDQAKVKKDTQPAKDYEMPLTGVKVTKAEFDKVQQNLPVGAMMDNITTARPHFGISEADVTYEALVEGGITRLMPIFHSKPAAKIMPIRSLRVYYADWCVEYQCSLVHIGGSGNVGDPRTDYRAKINAVGMRSIGVAGSYARDPNRVSVHSAFSSTELLQQTAQRLGFRGPLNSFTSWKYKNKDEVNAVSDPTAPVSYNFGSQGPYSVRWDYNADLKAYLRTMGGAAHIDAQNNKQVAVKNVIVMLAGYEVVGDSKGHVLYNTTGSGRAYIFRGNKAIVATWSKPSPQARTIFTDAAGKEVEFERGSSWVSVLPSTNLSVSY